MQNHNDGTIKTSDTVLRKIYLSLYLKGLLKVLPWEGVGDRTELQHIDPHSYGLNSVSFPFSWAAQPRAWCPASLGHVPRSSIFSPTGLISNWLTSCLHPGYVIVRHPPSCGRHKSHSIQPVHGQVYILIFLDRMHLLFTQVHFLFWQLGRDQYVTKREVSPK